MQKKGILLVGIILLLVGLFIWFSSSNIMSEVQSVLHRYEPSDYNKVAHYEQALQNIWNAVYPIEIVGFIVFVIGLSLSIAVVGMMKIEGGNKDKQT